MGEVKIIREQLRKLSNSSIAENSKKYLKSPYSFYGIRVPELRKIAKNYKTLKIYDVYNIFEELWNSGNHEEMCLAIFILENYKKQFNMETWNFVTNRLDKAKTWDHVDYLSSAILGRIVLGNPSLYTELKKMSVSQNPWIRRTSMVSNYQIIKKNKIELTFRLAEKLCYDEDTYVQKATGWMLREAGKKNRIETQEFITLHKNMKPIALSYATEKMLDLKKRLKEFKKEQKEKASEAAEEENKKEENLETIK